MWRAVCVSVVLVTCLVSGAGRCAAEQPRRSNILFLFSDDQRADTLSAYGNSHIRTPNLDQLVRDGFSFHHAYCMGSMHGAVCQPSRAMLHAGRTLYRAPLDLRDTPLLGEVLAAAGYTTFGTGKWHNGEASFQRSFAQGKAIFFGGMSDHRQVPLRDMDAEGKLGPKYVQGYSSELFADAAIGFLQQQPRDQPFFCYVAFTSPHDPRTPPEEFLRWKGEARPPLPPNFMPQHPFHNGWMVGRDESLAPWPRPAEMIRDQLAEYYGMIEHLDAQVGRILEALRAAGHADNTFVVFTSDHGLAMGSHGLLGKQSLYDHSMRSPLIVSGPGIRHGESRNLVYLFDLYPTICQWAGVDIPASVEGIPLNPELRGQQGAHRNTLFTAYEDVQRAVRDGRWKLIRYPKIHRTQLFDLQQDPHELRDLSRDPAAKPHLDRLMNELTAWQARVDDMAPLTAEPRQPEEIDLTGRPRTPDQWQPEEVIRKYFR